MMVPLPLAFGEDVAAGLLDDAVDRGEAEAGAAPDLLRREERLEDLLHHLRRHAGTGVDHLDQHIFAGLTRCWPKAPQSRSVTLAVRIASLPPLRHGVARVHGKVDDHLLELIADRS